MKNRFHNLYNLLFQTIGFSTLYFLLIGKKFIKQKIVIGGDTQLLWSYCYLFYKSLIDFGEFSWWDPTTLNGWPAYVNFTSGWYNFFNPLTLPVIGINYIAIKFFGVSVNGAIVFQKTLYPYILSLIAVILLSRQMMQNRLAQLFPPLVFTLCSIQFHFLRDSFLFEGFPAAIFYVYGLVCYFNNRTPKNLALYITFSGIFISSFAYSFLQAYLFWTGLFTLTLCLFHKDFIFATFDIIKNLFSSLKGRIYLGISSAYLFIAGITCYSSLYFNLGRIVRESGAGTPVDYTVEWGGTSAIYHVQSWVHILNWIPFPDIEEVLFKSDVYGGGSDHRYIGLATIPLILIALLKGYKNRFTLPLFCTTALCLLFITYTIHNFIILNLAENFDFFANIRTVANLLPRDGTCLLLIFLAGIGFDTLLTPQNKENHYLQQFLKQLLFVCMGIAFITLVAGLFFKAGQPIRHSLSHIGIYLLLFTILCILMGYTSDKGKKILGVLFLVFTLIDLSISFSHYWQRGKVWFENTGPHTLPTADKIVPIQDESQNWPGAYRGMAHNLFGEPPQFAGPFFGVKEWLVLVTHDRWKPVLENWNPSTRRITTYPSFRFYGNEAYVDFDQIKKIDEVLTPKERGVGVYLHDKEGLIPVSLQNTELTATYKVTDFTLNRVTLTTKTSSESHLVFLDNYDPFWYAKIDGIPVPVYRTNFTFKSIKLPPGKHIVEWEFDPYPIKISWFVFYIAFFLNLIGLRQCFKSKNPFRIKNY